MTGFFASLGNDTFFTLLDFWSVRNVTILQVLTEFISKDKQTRFQVHTGITWSFKKQSGPSFVLILEGDINGGL